MVPRRNLLCAARLHGELKLLPAHATLSVLVGAGEEGDGVMASGFEETFSELPSREQQPHPEA